MQTIKAIFEKGVFVPETRPHIPEGKTVLISFQICASEEKGINPSPSGDPYFSDPAQVEAIVASAKEVIAGKTLSLARDAELQDIFGNL